MKNLFDIRTIPNSVFSLFLLMMSFSSNGGIQSDFEQSKEQYYQNLYDLELSLSEKKQGWQVLYSRIKDSSFFNIKALTLYQLTSVNARLRDEREYRLWYNLLQELNQVKQDKVVIYLLYKVQAEQLFIQNDFHQVIYVGEKLSNAQKFVVVDNRQMDFNKTLTLPPVEVASTSNILGKAHYLIGEYIQAQKYFLKALSGFEALDDLKNVSRILNNLSVIAWTQKDVNKAIEYLDRGLVISEELNDARSIISKLSNKGLYLNALEELQRAENSFLLALNYPQIKELPKLHINTQLGLSEVYSKQKFYQKSENLISSALELSKQTNLEYSQFNAITALAGLRNLTQDYHAAISLYLEALYFYREKNFKKEESTVLLNLSHSHRELGDSAQALEYYILYHELDDKLKSNVRQKSLTQLQAKYENSERLKQIKMLQQENTLTAIKLKSADTKRLNLIIYGIAFFLIILLLYSRFNSIKEAKKLKLYTKEIESREKQLLLLSIAFKSTSDAVWITDQNFIIEAFNKAFTDLTERDDSVGQKMAFANVNGQDQRLTDSLLSLIESKGSWQGEAYDRKSSGEIYPIEIKIKSIKNDQGEVIHYLGVFRDISERRRAEAEIIKHATQDDLTGLPNRVLLKELIQRSFVDVESEGVIPALFFVNVDGFKKLNDSLGYETGDKFICAIAQRLTEAVRSKDVVSRLGGDEFGLLVELTGKKTEAGSFAKKILKAFDKPFELDGRSFKITVSLGIAIFSGKSDTAEELIRSADIAMNVAKQNGKNTFHFFEKHMNDEVVAILDMEQRLVNAIDNQYFEFYYQPIVDIKTQAIVGAEALIRCREPSGDMLFPDHFIPLVEKLGLIEKLDELVIDKVFSQANIWHSQSLSLKNISINLSPKIFENADYLIQLLQEKLATYQISASLIKIEITEGMLVSNIENVIGTMHRLKSQGFILAIDDFGAGFSSLNYLKQFPIDVLKIDRSFIMDMHDSNRNKSIVKSIIDLAHNLDFRVIAEGVEQVEHVDELSMMGCEEYQGYYFSKPLPVTQFECLIEKN